MARIWTFLGRNDGDFRLGAVGMLADPDWRSRLWAAFRKKCPQAGNVGSLYVFRPGFKSDVVEAGMPHLWYQAGPAPVFVSRDRCDGVVFEGAGVAAAVLTADCLVIHIAERAVGGRVALLHAARECLVPRSGAPSIVETVFGACGFSPESSHVYVGFGIRSCCYGFDKVPPAVLARYGSSVGVADKGPRKGKPSVDLRAIAKAQLRACGVSEDRISVNPQCTACLGREGGQPGTGWSNVWDGPQAGRNAVVAWESKD